MPTTAANSYTMDELEPYFGDGQDKAMSIQLKPSTTYRKGDALYELLASPGVFALYLAGNTDGTGTAGAPVPSVLLKRACITDASGKITYGTVVGGMEQGQTYTQAYAFYNGVFAIADLPTTGAGSLDTAGVASMGRKLKAALLKLV